MIPDILKVTKYIHVAVIGLFFCLPQILSADMEETAKKNIVFLGDSLTAGYGLEIENSYPSLIQNEINKASLDYNVVNAGVSGDTTAGGLSRLSWILNQKMSVFVLALGANDALRGLSPDLAKNNLESIIKKVQDKDKNIQILLIGMYAPPNLGDKYSENYKKIFLELSRKYNLAFIPFLLEGVAGRAELNLNDGIHPNNKGYQIIAGKIWEVLLPILKLEEKKL